MRLRQVCAIVIAASLASCAVRGPPAPSPETAPSPAGTAGPAGTATAPQPATTSPEQPAPGAHQFHLSPATAALVGQAHGQSAGGDFAQAAATLERALRIEPENPLLWIELGRLRLAENNGAQADALGRKALTLATGDPDTQSAAWRLIADSLRARGRNPEAADADARAAAAAPR